MNIQLCEQLYVEHALVRTAVSSTYSRSYTYTRHCTAVRLISLFFWFKLYNMFFFTNIYYFIGFLVWISCIWVLGETFHKNSLYFEIRHNRVVICFWIQIKEWFILCWIDFSLFHLYFFLFNWHTITHNDI